MSSQIKFSLLLKVPFRDFFAVFYCLKRSCQILSYVITNFIFEIFSKYLLKMLRFLPKTLWIVFLGFFACFGCVSFSMYTCGFSVPQMQQFCLFTYLPRSKWSASSVRRLFNAYVRVLCAPSILWKSIAGPLSEAHNHLRSAEGLKQIICQIRHELSVTIQEISFSWKNPLDGGPNIT